MIVRELVFKEKLLKSINCCISPKDHIFMPLLMCNDTKKLYQVMNRPIKFKSSNHLPDQIPSSNLPETSARFFHCKVANIHQSLDNSLL